jgi:hypothetical protein
MAEKEIKLKQGKIPKELLEMKRVKGKKIKLKQGKIPKELLEMKRVKGKEIKKRVYQEPLPSHKFAGGGKAIRGLGKAFMKGGKV